MESFNKSDRYPIRENASSGSYYQNLLKGSIFWVIVLILIRLDIKIKTSKSVSRQRHKTFWGTIFIIKKH